ncbi:MAG: DedA family protein [Bacteroides sp.]|nr:DedA family protein [Lachnospiraceae bacterium]MCM1331922.1 DedA family protein [Bacteroides sp.]MCM1388873.1 DedA family protein [Bacteroides sp.]
MLDLITLQIFDAHEFFNWFVENANYWFVFIFMVIESSFIPFPSELVVPPAAYLAMQEGSTMNIYLVTLVATAGALVGALINYYLALWVGRPIVYRFANSRMGHLLMINEEKVEKAEKYFDEHGEASTFFGRLIPVIRQLISLPAGIARMNIFSFMIFTSLGALVWNIALAVLGYFLSTIVPLPQLYSKVEEYNDYLTYVGYGIGILCLVYVLYRIFAPQKK